MIELLAVVLGLVAGFGGSRLLRRPSRSAGVASAARTVGSSVGSRRDLDLPRLQRSVLSEMMRHVTVRNGSPSVPSAFRVRLHPDDHTTVSQAPGFFKQGLEAAMAAAARDHGWRLPDRLTIDLASDPGVHVGAPRVDVDQPAAVTPADLAPAAAAPRRPDSPARLERSDGAPSHPLGPSSVTIGRAPERTIRVDDNRVSRRHASVAPSASGYTLIDEGSSNGTRLNGRAIEANRPTDLADGDRIGIGPIELIFRAASGGASGSSSDDATSYQRFLDEDQRRHISQEYFGGSGDEQR